MSPCMLANLDFTKLTMNPLSEYTENDNELPDPDHANTELIQLFQGKLP